MTISAEEVRAAMGVARSEWGRDDALEIFDAWQLDQLAELWAKVEDVPVTDEVRERVQSICSGDQAVRAALQLRYFEQQKQKQEQSHDDCLPDPIMWERVQKHCHGNNLKVRYVEESDDLIVTPETATYNRMFLSTNYIGSVMRGDTFMNDALISRVWCVTTGDDIDALYAMRSKVTVANDSRGGSRSTFFLSELLRSPKPMGLFFTRNDTARVEYTARQAHPAPIESEVRVMFGIWEMYQ